MKNCIIASTSTLHSGKYLDYLLPELSRFYENTSEIVFVPFAQPGGISLDEYTQKAAEAFAHINKKVVGLHTFSNPTEALLDTSGIFTGGGNTFRLVNALYKNDLMAALRESILSGTSYLGTSAGSNICGVSMQTTNDMPIVYPPSFKTLGILPFNLNPHYLDPEPNSTHMGETRETRIKEFHSMNNLPVVGLREGSWLKVKGNNITLKGQLFARIFEKNKVPYEIESGSSLNFLS